MHRSTRLWIAPMLLLAMSTACQIRDVQNADSTNTAGDSTNRPVIRPSREISVNDTAASIRRTGSGDAGVEQYTAAALTRVGDSLARGGTSSRVLRGHPTYQYLETRRERSGVPEVHDRWIDVTIVQAGRATLVSGGHVAGGRVETPGEHRGGTITGGTSRPVAAGDMMIIPAGIPHQYVIAAGDSLRCVTVKVLRPVADD
jgi:mannose-6-phosphate isomerase-like protein (cupin superfamily)